MVHLLPAQVNTIFQLPDFSIPIIQDTSHPKISKSFLRGPNKNTHVFVSVKVVHRIFEEGLTVYRYREIVLKHLFQENLPLAHYNAAYFQYVDAPNHNYSFP